MLDDDTRCYRHPENRASVSCQRCERPICPSCMVQASVGFHCPACTRSGGQAVRRTPARGPMSAGTGRQSVTVGLIAINVVAFLVQGAPAGDSGLSLQRWGLLFGPAIEAGEWWRVVTSGFFHGSLIHLGFNMFALWIFGQPLEQAFGPIRFALAYAAGLFGGAAAVLAFNFDTPTLGASGAVLGLAGALAAVLWARGIPIFRTSLGGIFVINLALPLLVPRISFWGHFGGIAAGFAAGWLLSWLPERYHQTEGSAILATSALCAVLAVAALFASGFFAPV